MSADEARHHTHDAGEAEPEGGRLVRWYRRAMAIFGGRGHTSADWHSPQSEEPVRPPRAFTIRVDTLDTDAQTHNLLEEGVCDRIFIYGRCHEEGRGTVPAADSNLTYALEGGDGWVELTDLGRPHGRRCARVKLVGPPSCGAAPPRSIVVHISAEPEGLPIAAEVVLGIKVPQHQEPAELPRADSAEPVPGQDPVWWEAMAELASRQGEPLSGRPGTDLKQLFELARQLDQVGSWVVKTSREDSKDHEQISPEAVQRLLRLTTTHLAGTLREAMESLRDRIDQSAPNLTVSLGALRSSTRTAIARLLGDIDHLAGISIPPGDPEADRALQQWLSALVTTMKRVIGSALRLLANALILAVRFMLHQQMLVFSHSFAELMSLHDHDHDHALERVLTELREIMPVQQPPPIGGTDQSTEAIYEHLVAFANHTLDQAAASHDTAPENCPELAGLPTLTRQLLDRLGHESDHVQESTDLTDRQQHIEALAARLHDFKHEIDFDETQMEHFADQADAVILGLQSILVLVASISTSGLVSSPPEMQERLRPVAEAAVLLRRTTVEGPQLVTALMGSMAISVFWAVTMIDFADRSGRS